MTFSEARNGEEFDPNLITAVTIDESGKKEIHYGSDLNILHGLTYKIVAKTLTVTGLTSQHTSLVYPPKRKIQEQTYTTTLQDNQSFLGIFYKISSPRVYILIGGDLDKFYRLYSDLKWHGVPDYDEVAQRLGIKAETAVAENNAVEPNPGEETK